jgi:hypothetical protein
MAIELDTERASRLIAEIVSKSYEKKISWTTTDQAYSATAGPLRIFIFRALPGPGWTVMHVALEGNAIFQVMNLDRTGIPRTPEMMTTRYRQNVDQISKLVNQFDTDIRESQFAKALDAISSL